MDSSHKLDMVEGRGTKSSQIHSISILVLSLLLTGCVATIIYMSVSPMRVVNGSETLKVVGSQSVKDQANLKFRNSDGSQMAESVEYDEDRDVAVFHGGDGAFQVEDLKKGLHIFGAGAGVCYVVPVSTNKASTKGLKEFIQNYHGQELNAKTEMYKAVVIPGTIEDTSFLPSEANDMCSSYQWMYIIEEEAESDDTEPARQKRSCRTTCGLVYRNGDWVYQCSLNCSW